jgi:peptide/nickel transport system ATP-binding protein
MTKLLEIKDLKVTFPTDDGEVRAVDGIDLTLSSGETVAIVGESGSGKTVTSLSILGLHNRASTNLSGQILVSTATGFVDVVGAEEKVVRGIRGKDAAMIFQDPMSSLHPYYSISNQLSEAFRIHNQVSKKAAHARSIEMLDLVGIPEPAKRAAEYPHQFSGGMRQRVMIAMALINNPKILIADEPTTALDVTVQAQILLLLKELQKEFKMGILLITHDLGVVAGVADRVNVMYAGKIVESGLVDEIYYSPAAPYTIGLLSSIPSVYGKGTGRLSAIPGQPPSLINLPTGCSFEPRCSLKSLVKSTNCATDKPLMVEDELGHFARCHLDLQTRRAEGKKVAAKGVK